jgi:hypothetical protein
VLPQQCRDRDPFIDITFRGKKGQLFKEDEKMKKLTILICVLAILLALTGVASASPAQPTKFRIKGYTTSVDLSGFDSFVVGLESAGKVIRHIQGTFTIDEELLFFTNSVGELTITTKKGDEVFIFFTGSSDGETVQGTFEVIGGTGAYQDFTGSGGVYEGIADFCVIPCDPFADPTCRDTYVPDCAGFYVDFTFDTY